jgi:hypothetical protein
MHHYHPWFGGVLGLVFGLTECGSTHLGQFFHRQQGEVDLTHPEGTQ